MAAERPDKTRAAASAITGILGLYKQIRLPPPMAPRTAAAITPLTISGTQVSREDYVLGRVDYTLSSTDSIFGRYVFDKAYNLSPLTGFFGAVLPYGRRWIAAKNQFFTAEERHIFSSTW